MGIKVGIVGCGQFGLRFIDIYKRHPEVDSIALADSVLDRVQKAAKEHGISETYNSLEEMLESDVDAVCIFTQRQLHGPMAISALKAGKHVCSAVPMATEQKHVEEIIELVAKTGLIYMTNETSYYYPNTIYVRDKYSKGEFGEFTYAEAHYLHDMDSFYEPFKHSSGPNWKRIAGFPPMFYPTHSVSMVLSVTGAHVTHVSCLGYRDAHEDGIFGEENNDFSNPFSNQSALMRTSDGGCCRINEFRRVVHHQEENGVAMSFRGTNASYDTGVRSYYTKRDSDTVEVTDQITCTNAKPKVDDLAMDEYLKQDFNTHYAPIHDVSRLPKDYIKAENGHYGSHQFLTDDFCKAVSEKKLPPNHAWAAAKYCMPGIIAHQSSIKGGEMMEVPYYGEAPNDLPRL